MLRNFIDKIFSHSTQGRTAPPSSSGYFSKAKTAFEQRNYLETRKFYLLDIEVRGNSPETLCGLGAAEAMLNDHAGAEQRFHQALQIDPGHLNARLGLANIKLLTKQHEESVRLFGALSKEFPEALPIQKSFQKALAEAARYSDLERIYLDRLSRAPDDGEAWASLSSVYLNLNRPSDADAAITRGLACVPLQPLLAFNRSYVQLQRGEFRAGWAMYENRHSLPKKNARRPEREWDGAISDIRKIIVYEEQGFGDLFLFSRFLPNLQALFETVELVCRSEVHELLRASFNISLRTLGTAVDDTNALSCYLPSLPYLLERDTLNDLEMRSAYIKPSASAVARFGLIRQHRAKARIGLVWAGAPARADDAVRTLPLKDIVELIDIPDVAWFLLQKGRDAPPEVRQRALNVADKIQNFNDLGAAIENLDAVVSVDTAPAHLAGAMGKETFLLEPFTNDWRWRIGATESPWYPSVRLFKAENDLDNRWGSAVSRLKGALFDRFRVA